MKKCIKYIVLKIVWMLFHLFRIFPVKRSRIVFEVYSGKQISCNPLSIYRYLKVHYSDLEMIWAVKSYDVKSEGCERYVSTKSLLYWYYLLTAKVFITNNSPYAYLPFRTSQLIINTWHGGGAYKIGGGSYQKNKVPILSDKYMYKIGEMRAINTSYVIASCHAFEDAFNQGYLIDYSKYLKIGMPRNDVFFDFDSQQSISKEVRTQLGFEKDAFVVLYAPTWRNSLKNPTFNFVLNCDQLVAAIKRRYATSKVVLLFRGHHLFEELLENQAMGMSSMINVSSYPDMQKLLCTANMLISDYSSTIWDYSFTYRPCFLFVPDLQEYKNAQGYYTPIEEWGFPMAESNEELSGKIQAFDVDDYRQAMEIHHKKLGSYEHGNATQLFCDFLMNEI